MSLPYIIFTRAYLGCSQSKQNLSSQLEEKYTLMCDSPSVLDVFHHVISPESLPHDEYVTLYNNLRSISGKKLIFDISTYKSYDIETGNEITGVKEIIEYVVDHTGEVGNSIWAPGPTAYFYVSIKNISSIKIL